MTAPAPHPTTSRRVNAAGAVFGTAAVIGLWLGLTAPASSPVTPPPPAVVAPAVPGPVAGVAAPAGTP